MRAALLAAALIAGPAAAQSDGMAIQARALALRGQQTAAGAAAKADAAGAAAGAASSTAQAAYTLASGAVRTVNGVAPIGGALTLAIPAAPDLSGYVKSTDVAASLASYALKTAVPSPATIAPMSETTGGSVGTMASVYALANHSHPRITDSQIVTTATGGTFSVSYPAGFFATPPTVDLTWVNTGALFMTCELTADPTVSGAAGRCRSLNLVSGVLALGAGIKVHVLSLPQTINK